MDTTSAKRGEAFADSARLLRELAASLKPTDSQVDVRQKEDADLDDRKIEGNTDD